MNTEEHIEADASSRPEDLRAAVRAALEGHQSQAALAREVGISGTALSQWLNERYKGDNDAVAAKVATWRRNREAASAAGAAASVGWVETASSQAIEAALLFAQDKGSIAVVYGGAGLGKTTATRHYAETNPNVWRVTASPSSASLMAMLELIAGALALDDIQNRPSTYAREIVRRLTGTRGLLVVDEAQHLSLQALEELRSIHDASAVGLAMLGNLKVYSRLGGSRQAEFAQLFSRVGFKYHVPAPTRSDTDAILSAWGIAGDREGEWAHTRASLPGGLRGVCNALRHASMAASMDGAAVDVRALETAWRSLGGEQ